MDIIEKARELGLLIAESEEMQAYKNAEAAVERDEKAKALLNEYKMLQVEMVKAVKGKKGKDEVDSVRERLLSKQQELNEYAVTKKFIESKNAFDNLIKTVNDVIIFSATGEEPCSPSRCRSCGKGCSQK